MARLSRVLSAAVIMSAGAALVPSSVQARTGERGELQAAQSRRSPVTQVARLATGTISGIVSDERGKPVAGAKVTAIGVTMALAETDASGRFITEALPAGEYVVKAHLAGFSASRREIVRVGEASTAVPLLQVRRLDAAGRDAANLPFPAARLCRRGSACRRRNRPATTPKLEPRTPIRIQRRRGVCATSSAAS